MYHRIANLSIDPWQLAVSPNNFEQQLQVLQKLYRAVSVNTLLEQVNNKTIAKNCICLTFDDGYYDNFFYAKPLLEKYNCPAAFFIPAQYIGKNNQFWWDELENIIFNSVKLPKVLKLDINERVFEFQLESEEQTENQLQKQKSWAWYDTPPTERCKLYLTLSEILKPLSFTQIGKILKEIRLLAGNVPECNKQSYPMTSLELKQIIKQPLFDVGMHTVTHAALSYHPEEVQQAEIVGSREYLRKNYERYINIIAYPHGCYNDLTLSIINKQNVLAGFTTFSQTVNKNSNPYTLGRFQVANWDGEEFEKHLYNWANN